VIFSLVIAEDGIRGRNVTGVQTCALPIWYTQSQKMMIFILAMSLYGLADLFTELLPEFQIGPVDLSIKYMVFVPIILVILFHPLYAALGSAVGSIIFGSLLLG